MPIAGGGLWPLVSSLGSLVGFELVEAVLGDFNNTTYGGPRLCAGALCSSPWPMVRRLLQYMPVSPPSRTSYKSEGSVSKHSIWKTQFLSQTLPMFIKIAGLEHMIHMMSIMEGVYPKLLLIACPTGPFAATAQPCSDVNIPDLLTGSMGPPFVDLEPREAHHSVTR